MKKIKMEECIRRLRSYAVQLEAEGQRHFSEDLCVAVDYLKRLQEQQKTDWIPCEERLPKKFDYVLGTFEQEDGYSTVDVLLCVDNKFYYPEDAIGYKGKKSIEVTAWQPLPAPYKKEGEK